MTQEENQNKENTTEENSISVEAKQEVVEDVPVVKEPSVMEVAVDEQVAPIEEVGDKTEQVEIPEVVESIQETLIVETVETSQTEPESTPSTTEIEPSVVETLEDKQSQPIPQTQTQEISKQPQQPQIKTVEKIVYQTPPNFIQNLLNKARAKIQERKRKKLDKIMSLFESNSEISNSDIQKLLRTTKRSATRYLNQLEKEQKITQVGNKGRSVKYIKKQ